MSVVNLEILFSTSLFLASRTVVVTLSIFPSFSLNLVYLGFIDFCELK